MAASTPWLARATLTRGATGAGTLACTEVENRTNKRYMENVFGMRMISTVCASSGSGQCEERAHCRQAGEMIYCAAVIPPGAILYGRASEFGPTYFALCLFCRNPSNNRSAHFLSTPHLQWRAAILLPLCESGTLDRKS